VGQHHDPSRREFGGRPRGSLLLIGGLIIVFVAVLVIAALAFRGRGSLCLRLRSESGPTDSRRARSLLTPKAHPLAVTRLSDIGERGAIEILSRIYDRGQPIGLGHDVGVVEWGDDYLVVTTDVVNQKTQHPRRLPPRLRSDGMRPRST